MTIISTVLIIVIVYQCRTIKNKRKFTPPKSYRLSKTNFASGNLYPNHSHAFPQTSSSSMFDDEGYEKPISSKILSLDDDDDDVHYESVRQSSEKSTSRQRSGKGAIRKRLPLQKPRWEKNKLTIRHLYHENTS